MGAEWSSFKEGHDPLTKSVTDKWYSDKESKEVAEKFVTGQKKLKEEIRMLKKQKRDTQETLNDCLTEQERLKRENLDLKQENGMLGNQRDCIQREKQLLAKENNILSDEKENALSRYKLNSLLL